MFDEVRYLEELESYLEGLPPSTIYLRSGVDQYSGIASSPSDFPWIANTKHEIDRSGALYSVLNECRLVKSLSEQFVLGLASQINCHAHKLVMQSTHPGLIEHQLAGLHKYVLRSNLASNDVYQSTCASGENASYSGYIANDRVLKDGDLILNRMGARYKGYISSITRTYPVNGRFTKTQKELYDIVLEAQNQVFEYIRAGNHFQDLQNMAEKKILEGLKACGVLKGGRVEEMHQKRVSYYFSPEAVGHSIGLRVHDVAPDAEEKIEEIPKQGLRVKRRLENNMVLSIGPGIYFNPILLKKASESLDVSKFIDEEKIKKIVQEVHGIKIEDNLVCQKDGIKLLTNSLPRTTKEIEDFLNK